MKRNAIKKDIIGWCLYDWANSAFAVCVLAGFFPILFRLYWNNSADSSFVTARLGLGESIAGLIVACLSPVLGSCADLGRMKKAFLATFVIIGVSATALLFFVNSGLWVTAIVLFVIANIGFSCGNMFYDSLLVDVADEKNMDFISSLGYGIGYVGGGLLFVFDVVLVMNYSFFGFSTQIFAMKMAFLSVALWWFVFAIPLFSYVTERKPKEKKIFASVVKSGIKQLGNTAKKIIKNKALLLFLLAFWLYMDGVYTFIMMAVNFGMSLGFKPPVLMIALIVVQFVAFPCSIACGYLARRIGAVPTILASIGSYLLVCILGSFLMHSSRDFIILSGFVALAQGGIQALSRSHFAKIVPQNEATEYFGFLNVIGKFSVVLGPILVGGMTLVAHKFGALPLQASRIGMSSIAIVFFFGGILLMFSEKERNRRLVIS